MDNEIVIQLAKYNDKTTNENSSWSNHTHETITLNEGDQVLVSKAFIDTRNLTSANITIEQDLELELEFYFYWINDSNPGSSALGFSASDGTRESWLVPLDPLLLDDPAPGYISLYAPEGFKILNNDFTYIPPSYSVQITSQATQNIEFNTASCLPSGWTETAPNVNTTSGQNVVYADGRPYVMCYSDNSKYTQTWKYTLKAGSYSPDSLASLLTLNMATVNKDKPTVNNKAGDWFDSGEPFVANTTAYPPIWSMSNTDYSEDIPEGPFFSVINSNPFIQIDKSRGSVLDTDWFVGSTGSVGYTGQPDFTALPYLPLEQPGAPPKKSLCFKNFITDNPTPNPSINLPNITNPIIIANKMIPGLYYKIITVGSTNWIKSGDTNPIPSIGDEFLCKFTGTVPEKIIPITQMSIGQSYQIVTLGNIWNGLYDTNWLGISNTLITPTVGQIFVCQNNTALQTTTTEAEIDTINNFLFTSIYGYDLSKIGGPYLPSNKPIAQNISTAKINDWLTLVSLSPKFNGRTSNNIDYTQFMGAGITVPTINTQYISLIDMSAYIPLPLNGYTDLNVVPINMILQVTTIGNVRWDKLGYVYDNPIIQINDPTIVLNNYYIVENSGILFGLNNSINDTNWKSLTGNSTVNKDDTVKITSTVVNRSFDNGEIVDIGIITPGFVDVYVIITNMGTSISSDWFEYGTGASGGSLGLIFKIESIGTSLNGKGAEIQILFNAILALNMKILVTNANKINWALYTSTPNIPVVTNDIITITNIPPPQESIIGAGTGFTPMTDTFQVIPTGTIKSIFVTTPFEFKVSILPTTPFVDNSIPFVANTIPSEFILTTLNYTLPLKPFKPTGTLTSNVINKKFSCDVIPTGTIEQNVVEGTCQEIWSPDTPNFYIYPLTLQAYTNSVSYFYTGGEKINQFFGGPQFKYGFPLVGSTEIELAFNDNTNRFQWNYTHSPILQGPAPGSTPVEIPGQTAYSEVVGMLNSFTPNDVILQPANETAYNSSTCKLTAQSGILFRKMEPASFWNDILGFSKDLLVTDEELGFTEDGTLNPITPDNKNRFTMERFSNITTSGLLTTAMNFTTLDTFPNAQESYVPGLRANTNSFNNIVGPVQLAYSPVTNSWASNESNYDFYKFFGNKYAFIGYPNNGLLPVTPILNSIYYQALDETKYINSISPPLLVEDKYGHYLISIDGYGDDKNGIINENQKILSKAIVSNYYVNENSFVSLTFPDSQVYTHVGEPIQLNNFRIAILNPETMKPIDGLGENSSVYIQINKQYSKEDLTEIN